MNGRVRDIADDQQFVGRGGEKLRYALDHLGLDVTGKVAADFGCNVGGFTDCLLQAGAARAYAVDTGYGVLAWKLRQDERVVVMERTNAMHVELPEPIDVVAIDVAWTRQRNILPNALAQLGPAGVVLSLFKPQYEAPREWVRKGRVQDERLEEVLAQTLAGLADSGIKVQEVIRLPLTKKSKNPEAMLVVSAPVG